MVEWDLASGTDHDSIQKFTIIPAHKKYLVVSWQNYIYIQHNAVEGLSSAGGIQGMPADACIEILCANKITPVFKWVDNFVIFRSPTASHSLGGVVVYDYDLTNVTKIMDPLGIPWHPISKKGQEFGPSFTYLSFQWDLTLRSVSLPNEKRPRTLLKLSLFLSKPRVFRKDCTSLHSSLKHVSFVYHNARCELPALSTFLSKFPNDFAMHHTPHAMTSEMNLWRDCLTGLMMT